MTSVIIPWNKKLSVIDPSLQKLEATPFVLDTRHVRAEDFIDDALPYKPCPGSQYPRSGRRAHRLACSRV